MKKNLKPGSILLFILGILSIVNVNTASAQQDTMGTISVKGDISKYYVVTFRDAGAPSDHATELEIGRSNIHQDSSWRGSLIARFRYHVNNWGTGSEFIDADIRQANSRIPAYGSFIAGWADGSFGNATATIIIWLRGNTTYKYFANHNVTPTVYDGSPNPLSFTPTAGGTTFGVKSAVDNTVNTYGSTIGNTAYFNGVGTNYFGGNLGIGTRNTGTNKLAVEGTIAARKIKVTQASTWPDFVFDSTYQLPSLQQVETYIQQHKHLPEVPSASEVAKEGFELAEMNKILLQKIEEMTLHLIEQNKRNLELEEKVKLMAERLDKLESK
ncbi:hypothetical protein [Chitinophaga pinensis]|uniref:Uncharacterized protein n=1 Tax=Chitinophaga pinensis (strain ATCC 43595 / DSM 2588 / LMG 13176 / NBRC 15968 / NCIMB 11800 / UQM 2034) TaxID=485918 RepID=A0A979G6S5_CHIPD|nr:hypothetical protein [Chitinophaga pinensis]ACU61723.1 hypothetical protein Cpin_4274 [Chitinophaga pinensis DSM 2588]